MYIGMILMKKTYVILVKNIDHNVNVCNVVFDCLVFSVYGNVSVNSPKKSNVNI